ncbi:hypothetical protein [Halobacterium zhouii]|uniref:hypothetical protein n=1 Tax=Halobacterium zhouii TaxID=2902624 RepID=UPI001E33EFCC|nr:hypothetical protein [Halobacterium zhouii]
MRSPTRRAALAVCVALLLVTAGCSGGTTPTSTTTSPDTTTTGATTTTSAPATTTSTGTWSPNASVEQYPPGVAANGTLTNRTTLLNAHFDATANESVVHTIESKTANEHVVRRFAHAAGGMPTYRTVNRTTDGKQFVTESYLTRSNCYSRAAVPNRTVYTVTQNSTSYGNYCRPNGPFVGPRLHLDSALMAGNYSVNGTVERNGRTLVQLTADEPSKKAKELSTTSYEGTALVTPEGVIYSVDMSMVQEIDDSKESYEESMTLDTSVDWSGPPPWMGDLPHLSISVVEDGHALEIRNTGGPALPANVSFEVYVENATEHRVPHISPLGEHGTVTTDARLESGDAVYVTAGADGNASSFALHNEQARGEYTFTAVMVYGEHGNTVYSLVTGTRGW